MKAIGVRALRENPAILSESSENNEAVLVLNRNKPISLAVPLDDALLSTGVQINLAVRLYEQEVLSLGKASQVAGLPVESFLHHVAAAGVEVVDQSEDELLSDLDSLND